MAVFDWAAAGKKHRNREKSSSDAETCGKKSPRRGIEPRSGTRQAPILTIKLSRNIRCDTVVLRARVIPECLDNPNINSLREVTSCQNSLSD